MKPNQHNIPHRKSKGARKCVIEVEYWDFILSYLHADNVPVSKCASSHYYHRWNDDEEWLYNLNSIIFLIINRRRMSRIKCTTYIRMHNSRWVLIIHQFIFTCRKLTRLMFNVPHYDCRRKRWWGMIMKWKNTIFLIANQRRMIEYIIVGLNW